jgi:hypothetical protein
MSEPRRSQTGTVGDTTTNAADLGDIAAAMVLVWAIPAIAFLLMLTRV